MSGFTFQWFGFLFLVLLALPLMWMLGHARKRRAELIVAMGGGLSTHRRLRDYLRVAAFILLVLALARPGYSPENQSISQTGRDVVFALDVSQSMLAEDVSPSRLEVSKQAIRDALNGFSNERVGLVVYAGSATIMCPLTYDYDFVRYMLEQVHTRSADFGGTAVQSAVEKVVDQVFMKGRTDVQDLVILTDGGDNGSRMERVVELLDEHSVDLLLLGIGNPNEGAPIPVVNSEGVRTLLRTEEAIVYTRLDDASLRDLATESSDAVYVPVGVNAFDLAQVYSDYVEGREVSVSSGGEGVLVYREAAVFFLFPALVLLLLSESWGAKGLQFGQSLIVLGAFSMLMPNAEAFESGIEVQLREASILYTSGTFGEAANLYGEVANSGGNLSPAQLAAVELNRGLCLMEISRAESTASPSIGLDYAQQAQLAFLAAKRYTPEMTRSGVRLESAAAWMTELQLKIEEEQAKQEALDAEMQHLIELLEALLEAQQTLEKKVSDSDVDRPQPRRKRRDPRPPPIVMPEDAPANAKIFSAEELGLKEEAERIYVVMEALDEEMTPPELEGMPEVGRILGEPLRLMEGVPAIQQGAAELLLDWNTWPAAKREQKNASKVIEEILVLLNNNSSDESDGDEEEEGDYEEDYEYSEDSDESMSNSTPVDGDLAAGTEMQALPLPNYSAEDILNEEQGNLQFREQQRANANAAKVEKDY